MEVELGKIVGVWGVKGWIKLHAFTRHRIDIAQYKTWWLKPAGVKGEKAQNAANEEFSAVKVLNCKEQGKGIVAQLDGVTDPDQAMTFNGHGIWVLQSDLPSLPNGEYYWQQLIGLDVINKQAFELGTVESILETGANDVLVIKAKQDSSEGSGKEVKEVLVPYADQFIEEIDIEQGTMIVDWDPSYLND